MLRKRYYDGKIRIISNQKLLSLIKNSWSIRAEVNDISNPIFDGSFAIILSDEISIGNYPFESLRYMKNILMRNKKIYI